MHSRKEPPILQIGEDVRAERKSVIPFFRYCIMESEAERLDFSYRYPFSKEALQFISSAGSRIEEKFLKLGRLRVEEDINARNAGFTEVKINEIKLAFVISYVYSRMLASALNDRHLLGLYINAECGRVRAALKSDSPGNMLKLAGELGVRMSESNGSFMLRFDQFLNNKPKGSGSSLVYKDLDKGDVYLSSQEAADILGEASRSRIAANLPISQRELPKEVIEYSKGIRKPARKIATTGRSYAWIDKILSTPINDVRHRTVNLILAPYLVNVKGMAEADAAKIITEYIERCKELNSNTKVNPSYISYQCRYAKSKGMKPLSLKRAKEMYEGVIDLG